MLVLGAQLGLLFGLLCRLTFPGLGVRPAAFGVVGLAAFFTGVVRAPVNGIVLVVEMTAGFPMLLPMLAACFTALLVPTPLGTLAGAVNGFDATAGRPWREVEGQPGAEDVRPAAGAGRGRVAAARGPAAGRVLPGRGPRRPVLPGASVTLAAGEEEPLAFTVLAGDGWE
jgi:hypothetical protein